MVAETVSKYRNIYFKNTDFYTILYYPMAKNVWNYPMLIAIFWKYLDNLCKGKPCVLRIESSSLQMQFWLQSHLIKLQVSSRSNFWKTFSLFLLLYQSKIFQVCFSEKKMFLKVCKMYLPYFGSTVWTLTDRKNAYSNYLTTFFWFGAKFLHQI